MWTASTTKHLAPGAGVIVLISFNDVNSHIICKQFRFHSSFVWSLGMKIFIRKYGRHTAIDDAEQEFEALVSPSALFSPSFVSIVDTHTPRALNDSRQGLNSLKSTMDPYSRTDRTRAMYMLFVVDWAVAYMLRLRKRSMEFAFL